VCETNNLKEFGGPPEGGTPCSTRKVESHNTGLVILYFDRSVNYSSTWWAISYHRERTLGM